MKKRALFVPAIVLAAACSGSSVSLQPGRWELSMQFSSIEAPGADPARLAQLREAMVRPQTMSSCMTPQQAANPTGNMLNPQRGGQNCQFNENVFTDGAIRIHGTCQPPGGGSDQMNMEGTYTPTTMNVQLRSEMTMPPGRRGPRVLRMSGTMTGRRIGDCAAGG